MKKYDLLNGGINDTKHCTINDVSFLTRYGDTENYKTSHNNISANTSTDSSGWVQMTDALLGDVKNILETFWGQNFTMNVEGQTTSNVIGTEMSAYMTNTINTLTDTVLATLLVQQLYGKDAYDVAQGQFDYTGLFANKINPVNSIIKSKIQQKAA